MKRLVTTALTALLFGQPPPPVFRSTTDIVEIDVVVRDKTGKFVLDLSAEDFDVRDEGQPQPVELISLVASGRSPLGSADSAAAVASPVSRARVFVAIFDDAHLSAENFRNAQTAATELLVTQFRSGDVGGVVVGGAGDEPPAHVRRHRAGGGGEAGEVEPEKRLACVRVPRVAADE